MPMTSMSTSYLKNRPFLYYADFLIPYSLSQTCSYLSLSHMVNGSTIHLSAHAKHSTLSFMALFPYPPDPIYLSIQPTTFTIKISSGSAKFPRPTTAPIFKVNSIIHLGHCKRMMSLLLLLLMEHFLYKQAFLKNYQITALLPCFSHLE